MSQIFYHLIDFQIKLRILRYFYKFNGFRWNFVPKSLTIDIITCHQIIYI